MSAGLTKTVQTGLTPSTQNLAELAQALSLPRADIEDAFSTVGDCMAKGSKRLNALYQEFQSLPTHLQDDSVEDASDRLRRVGHACLELSEAFDRERDELAILVDRVNSAEAPLTNLQRSLKVMSILAINARVAAAGVDSADGGIGVFTNDITALSRSANDAIEDFTRLYLTLRRQVTKASEQRTTFETRYSGTLTKAAGELETGLNELDQHRSRAMEGSAETSALAKQISSRIAAAVLSLQVGDSTRQRLEHIEAGLLLAADAEPEAANVVLALQQAQLSDTVEQFDQEVVQIEKALSDLASDAGQIMKRTTETYAADGAQEGSILGPLGVQLSDTVAMLRDCEGERSKMDTTVSSVQAMAGTLLGHVEVIKEIESSMRLVSLNAAIKCTQLGPLGASLSIIAQQLRELTAETVSSAADAIVCLRDVSDLAVRLKRGTACTGARQIGTLDQEARDALGVLAEMDMQLAGALELLGREGPRVRGELDDAARALSRQAQFTETLADVHIQLSEHCTGLADDVDLDDYGTVVAPIVQSYTMEAERRIHNQMFGNEAASRLQRHTADPDDMDFML